MAYGLLFIVREDNMKIEKNMDASCEKLVPFIEGLNTKEYCAFFRFSQKLLSSEDKIASISADDVAELFLTYSGRIKSMIKKSMELAEKGEAYINTCMRYMTKSLQRAKQKKNELEAVFYSLCDEHPGYVISPSSDTEGSRYLEIRSGDWESIEDIPPAIFLGKISCDSRRLLLLCLKCAWDLDQDMIRKVASKLGVPVVWLESLVEKAVLSLEPARLKLRLTKEKANVVWIRMRMLELRITREEDEEMWKKEARSLERCRKRYNRLLHEKQSIRFVVSNSVIAALLKLPKGSVDSGLYYLKNQYGGKHGACRGRGETDTLLTWKSC
jgi:hypothetical protein